MFHPYPHLYLVIWPSFLSSVERNRDPPALVQQIHRPSWKERRTNKSSCAPVWSLVGTTYSPLSPTSSRALEEVHAPLSCKKEPENTFSARCDPFWPQLRSLWSVLKPLWVLFGGLICCGSLFFGLWGELLLLSLQHPLQTNAILGLVSPLEKGFTTTRQAVAHQQSNNHHRSGIRASSTTASAHSNHPSDECW